MTFGEALDEFKLCDLTQEDVQEAINIEAQIHSPKTVRNNHGLISAVVKQYRPDPALNTALPKKIRPDIYVLSDEDIKALVTASKSTELELPILLAVFDPMRRGEICALNTKISKEILYMSAVTSYLPKIKHGLSASQRAMRATDISTILIL